MAATLKVHSGEAAGQVHELSSDYAIIGRNTFCDIVIPVHSISRQHARIVREGDAYFLEDLESLNGTFVNGMRISSRTPLKDNDRIHLYEVMLTFHAGQPAAVSTLDLSTSATVQFDPLAPSAIEEGPRHRSTTIVNTLDGTKGPRVDIRSAEKLKAVLDITRNLGMSLSLDAFLPNILDSLFEIFPQADRGYVLLVDRPGGQLSPAAIKDRRKDSGNSLTIAPISRSIAARVMSEGKAILSTDSDDSELSQSVLEEAVTSMMSVPLVGPSGNPVGIIHIDSTDSEHHFTPEDLEVLISVAMVAGQAVEHVKVHQASLKLDRRERELSTAREVQLHFLPQQRPSAKGYRFFDFYRAADDVGGDYFGYVALPDHRWAIAVGDVSGKGVSAALMMARLCSEVRYSLVTEASPVKAVERLNRNLIDPTLEDRFITFLVAIIDPATNRLVVVNAGHMPPVLRRWSTGKVEQLGLEGAGPPLGFDQLSKYATCEVMLEPGDLVVMYTDGISEATNAEEQVYGIPRLLRMIGTSPVDVERAGKLLLEDVDRFVGESPQADDICLLAFGRPRPGKA